MHRSWMAAWEDRNAAELWSSRFLRPRPPIFVDSPANDHTVSVNELHRNYSIQSQTELSKFLKALLCLWCGTTHRE